MDLTKFCSIGDHREFIRTPFNLNGKTMATNGHILVVVPQRDGYGDYGGDLDRINRINSFFDHPEFDYLPLPSDIEFPPVSHCKTCRGNKKASLERCEECDGEGLVKLGNVYNTYDIECKTCDGKGQLVTIGGDDYCVSCNGLGERYEPGTHIPIFGVNINPIYLKTILDVKNLKVHGLEKEMKLYFKGDDIEGLIMGIRV